MKRHIYIINIIALAALSFSSCNGWFDVQPKTEIKEEKLFSNANGFRSALTGVYTSMAGQSLYGSELTMSFLDVLAQYYDLPNNTFSYYNAQHYKYGEDNVKSTCLQVWSNMYTAIANANNVIAHVDQDTEVLTPLIRGIVKGEMLGARAFMHFDLLRMFGKPYSVGTDDETIPYVDAVSRLPFKRLSQKEVLIRIESDCKEALALMSQYDPMSGKASVAASTSTEKLFLSNREEHLNWRAVRALQCRIAMWKGDFVQAESIASELLGMDGAYFANNLFALYNDRLSTYSENYFAPGQSTTIELSQQRLQTIYETQIYGSNDRRSELYVSAYPNTTNYFVRRWFKTNVVAPIYMPVITTAELHYIVAECAARDGRSQQALDVINDIHDMFGLSTYHLDAAQCDAMEEVQKDFRKHFIGLGQMFYWYKRQNLATIPDGLQDVDMRAVYALPIPEEELEFGL